MSYFSVGFQYVSFICLLSIIYSQLIQYILNACEIHCNRSKKDSEDLYAIIAQRQNERKGRIDSMFSSLVQKYGGETVPEPSEEEFEATRIKLERRRTSKRK